MRAETKKDKEDEKERGEKTREKTRRTPDRPAPTAVSTGPSKRRSPLLIQAVAYLEDFRYRYIIKLSKHPRVRHLLLTLSSTPHPPLLQLVTLETRCVSTESRPRLGIFLSGSPLSSISRYSRSPASPVSPSPLLPFLPRVPTPFPPHVSVPPRSVPLETRCVPSSLLLLELPFPAAPVSLETRCVPSRASAPSRTGLYRSNRIAVIGVSAANP